MGTDEKDVSEAAPIDVRTVDGEPGMGSAPQPEKEPDAGAAVDDAKQPEKEPDIEQSSPTREEVAEVLASERPRIRKYVGVQISVADADKHLQRPDVPEECPVSALVIEGVCDVPWPAGVSWIDAVKAILNPTAR